MGNRLQRGRVAELQQSSCGEESARNNKYLIPALAFSAHKWLFILLNSQQQNHLQTQFPMCVHFTPILTSQPTVKGSEIETSQHEKYQILSVSSPPKALCPSQIKDVLLAGGRGRAGLSLEQESQSTAQHFWAEGRILSQQDAPRKINY